MTFSQNWETLYREKIVDGKDRRHICKWPWTEVVSYVMGYFDQKDTPGFSVLELGCGAGANIPFFQSLGARYYGIDGSEMVISLLHENYPDLKENLIAGDFTRDIPFDVQFDLVLDRGSLTHNATEGIRNCLEILDPKLKDGATFITTGLQSTVSDYFKTGGQKTEDPFSRRDFTSGPFTGTGLVHFADREHILSLFSRYEFLTLEHDVRQAVFPETRPSMAAWSFVAVKKQRGQAVN